MSDLNRDTGWPKAQVKKGKGKPKPKAATNCAWCDAAFHDGELKYPSFNCGRKDAQQICNDCYSEHFGFTCCVCQNYAPKEQGGEVGGLIVVAEDGCGVPVGLYEVLNWPFYGQPLIGSGHIYESAVKRVGDVPQCDTEGMPCGEVCRCCRDKLLAVPKKPRAKKKGKKR